MTTYTFTVTGMHCASCAMLIDETLEDELDGVHSSQTSVRKGKTTVVTNGQISADAIAAAIATAGYWAALEASA